MPQGCDVLTGSWLGHVFACFCSNSQLVLSSAVGPLLSFSDFLERWRSNITNWAVSLPQWTSVALFGFCNLGLDNDKSVLRERKCLSERKSQVLQKEPFLGHPCMVCATQPLRVWGTYLTVFLTKLIQLLQPLKQIPLLTPRGALHCLYHSFDPGKAGSEKLTQRKQTTSWQG